MPRKSFSVKSTRLLAHSISLLLVVHLIAVPLQAATPARFTAIKTEMQPPNPTPTPAASTTTGQTSAPAPYTISPSSGVQGKEYEVLLSSSECLQKASELKSETAANSSKKKGASDDSTKQAGDAQKPSETKAAATSPKAELPNMLNDYVLYAPDGSGIRTVSATTSDCLLTARLSVAPDAPLGVTKLWLKNKEQALIATIDFTITGITAGPIPPGLNNKGQVDVMWNVLPDQVVHDNFGSKIATEYYCIEAVIGNDSGYDIQLASLGFTVPSFSLGDLKYRIPTTGYRIARGTLQRRELFAPRSLILNALKVTGPLLTGFTPYFHNIPHKANFSEAINIISNPLEKGLEFALPDSVPGQLDRLADQTFRDDISTRTVIPNNIQARVMTFVPKNLLFPSDKKGNAFKRLFAGTSANKAKSKETEERRQEKLDQRNKARGYAVAKATKGVSDTDDRLNKTPKIPIDPAYLDRNNPQDVMTMLGEIVIIGEQVEHVNRVRVVATGLGAQITDFAVAGKITDVCNLGVSGVSVTLTAGNDFTSRQTTTDDAGLYTFANVPSDRTYTVAATKEGVSLSPKSPGSETFMLKDTKNNINFDADLKVFTIKGRINKGDTNEPFEGVKVKLTGASTKDATTDKEGKYEFKVDDAKVSGDFVITPADTGEYTFADSIPRHWNCNQRKTDFTAKRKPK